MTDVAKLRLKKHKILKEDGRYLIYFTFEEENSTAEKDGNRVDSKADGDRSSDLLRGQE